MVLDFNCFFPSTLSYDQKNPLGLKVSSGFWAWFQRVVFWICSPKAYSEETKKALSCFKKFLTDSLGEPRLNRIQKRYRLDINDPSSLLVKNAAKFVIGSQDVQVSDIEDFLQKEEGSRNFSSLGKEEAAHIIENLSTPLSRHFKVPDIQGEISGRATSFFSRIFYSPSSAARERLQLVRENPTDLFDVFIHNMAARVIKREMKVGTIIPAPNHSDGGKQYYYVSAKVVSGQGMVSYLMHPLTRDTNLPPIRFFRGSAFRNGEVDAMGTLITDLEENIGQAAFESGQRYDPFIEAKLTVPEIEVGHSLGGVMVQKRALENGVRKIYLFNSPGISEEEVQKFNQMNKKMDIVIRVSSDDYLWRLGEASLGYQSPENVKLELNVYHKSKADKRNPHVAVFGKGGQPYGIQGGFSKEASNALLLHKNRKSEKLRKSLGPPIADSLKGVSKFMRTYFKTRTGKEMGLRIGSLQNGRWQIDHFR